MSSSPQNCLGSSFQVEVQLGGPTTVPCCSTVDSQVICFQSQAQTGPGGCSASVSCCQRGEDNLVRCFRVSSTDVENVAAYSFQKGAAPALAPCCKLDECGLLLCSKPSAEQPVAPCCSMTGRNLASAVVEPGRHTMFWVWVVEVASGLHCTAEGVASITLAAMNGQISLLLFGLDSIIEVASVLLVIWRLTGKRSVPRRERFATGGIGALLVLLFCAAVGASIVRLVRRGHPETAVAGLVIGCISTLDMLCFWLMKRSLAKQIRSRCLASDATCSLACSLLGAVLILGSVMFIVRPSIWWADAAAALVLSLFILKEGIGMLSNALSSNFEVGGCC